MNILTVVGARPQFIKVAAVSRIIEQTSGINEKIIHTGQHFDANLSSIFFSELRIPEPSHNLEVMGGGHGAMTGRMMEKLETVMLKEKPDGVLIYGDTNSTLAGALVAVKLHIPLFHVEAGLRSFNRAMPEEINRIISDQLSEQLFCPTSLSVANLEKEGITKGVHHVGDVMYDATLFASESSRAQSDILDRIGVEDGDYLLCTLHRAENTDDEQRFRKIISFLEEAATDRVMVFPVHPRTKQVMQKYNIIPKGIKLIDPVGYLDIHRLLAGAVGVYTDSGGLQKEAYFHNTPCVTLRDETEWVETIESGWNRLWTSEEYSTPRRAITDYGEGQSARKIVDILLSPS